MIDSKFGIILKTGSTVGLAVSVITAIPSFSNTNNSIENLDEFKNDSITNIPSTKSKNEVSIDGSDSFIEDKMFIKEVKSKDNSKIPFHLKPDSIEKGMKKFREKLLKKYMEVIGESEAARKAYKEREENVQKKHFWSRGYI